MSVFARDPRRSNEEQPGGGSGLEVDLDLQVCPECRRELHPWQDTCPDHGVEGVPRTSLTRADLPPPPPELLEDPED